MPRKKNSVRKDGLIAVQIYLGVVDGKRKYKTVYGHTQKEADRKADEVKAALQKGLNITAGSDTFGEWAAHLLKIKAGGVSSGRLVVIECHVKHLNAQLGNRPISKIRTADIQDIISDLAIHNPNTGRPMAKETLKGMKSTAKQIFQLAIDNRVMDYNPVHSVKIPEATKPFPHRALTEEEQQWFIDTPHRAQRIAMIMMYAGLRRGELIPLTWNDIDLKNKTININKAVEFVKGKSRTKEIGKNSASIRSIDIPLVLVRYLEDLPRDSMLVCPSASMRLHTESSWRRTWQSYLADLNIKYGDFTLFEKEYKSKYSPGGVPFVIPRIMPHSLRHTYATLLYKAGVDILTAKAQLGHDDIKTTLAIYTHLDKIHKRKSIDRLDAYLANASTMQVDTR